MHPASSWTGAVVIVAFARTSSGKKSEASPAFISKVGGSDDSSYSLASRRAGPLERTSRASGSSPVGGSGCQATTATLE
jgi:hypothetical protein